MATTKTPDATELNLPERVQNISAFFQAEASFKPKLDDAKEGTVYVTPDKNLVDKLVEAKIIDEDAAHVLRRSESLIADITAGATDAHGTLSQDFLKKHGKVDAVVVDKLIIGRGKLRIGYEREAHVGIGENASIRHGHLTAKFTTKMAGTDGAAFGRIRQSYATKGAALFGGKK